MHFRGDIYIATQVYKPGSVLTAIYLVPQLLKGSSHLLGTTGPVCMSLHGVAPDRVYIVKPMSPWAGCALTAPFHPCPGGEATGAVYLCCTCPGVTPGGRYPLSLPCEARTFLTRRPFALRPRLSNLVARNIVLQTGRIVKSPCKFFSLRIYYKKILDI